MAFSPPQIVRPTMPGAFAYERRQSYGSSPRLSGINSHVFQPPRTPAISASSSMHLSRNFSTYDPLSSHITAGRKRTRSDSGEAEEEEFRGPGSPRPFVNTRYQLAGGLDTPQQLAQDIEMRTEYSDVGYRRLLSGTLDRQSYAHPSGQQHSEGWIKPALGVFGGVVGKVWEFCKTSAFRGFSAGGGKDYSTASPANAEEYWKAEAEKSPQWECDSPMPAQTPEQDFSPGYFDHAAPDDTPARPAKRRQVSNNNYDELATNWVVVPEPEAQPERQIVQRPRSEPRTSLPSPARYTLPTASSAGRGLASPRPSSSASRAGTFSRTRPLVPTQSRISHAGSPALNSRTGASFASPRNSPTSKIPRRNIHAPLSSPAKVPDSPAARQAQQEAQRWAASKLKEDREADESMRRLESQLKAMIREGKEALGTKVEVTIDDDDMFGPKSSSRPW